MRRVSSDYENTLPGVILFSDSGPIKASGVEIPPGLAALDSETRKGLFRNAIKNILQKGGLLKNAPENDQKSSEQTLGSHFQLPASTQAAKE